MKFPARRRRQRYDFKMTSGSTHLFTIKQYNMYKPQAYLVLTEAPQGPSNHSVKIDVSTYNRRGEMRDNRMLTVTVFVSEYDFWLGSVCHVTTNWITGLHIAQAADRKDGVAR